MLRIERRLLCLISIVLLFISCASQENKNSSDDAADTATPVATPTTQESYVRVLPQTELQFPAASSACSLLIESSGWWEISGANEWCSLSAESGSDGDRVVIFVTDNMLAEERSVNLVVKCDNVEVTISIAQDPKIETTYVDMGFDNGAIITDYDETSGVLKVSYDSDVMPTVEVGNTIVMPDEYMFDIRVVDSVTSDSNTLIIETSKGNMCNIFSNVNFTLASNVDILALNTDGTPVIVPMAVGYIDESGEYVEQYNVSPSRANSSIETTPDADVVSYNEAEYYAKLADIEYEKQMGGPSPGPMLPYVQQYDASAEDRYLTPVDEQGVDDMCMIDEEMRDYLANYYDDVPTEMEWLFNRDYSGMTLYKGDVGRLWWDKCTFDASLNCIFDFKFGGDNDDNIIKKLGKLEYFSYKMNGSFGADLLMRYEYTNSASYSDDKIIKYNVIPTRIYSYQICGAPIYVLIYTHLGRYIDLGASGTVEASAGLNYSLDVEAGMSWSENEGVKVTKSATPHISIYHPTLQAEAKAHAKVSYYPQIEVGFYGFCGTWIEPRPYIKDEIKAGFGVSTDDNNYIGWTDDVYTGLDMRMGLKLDFGFWDKELWRSNTFSVVEDTLLVSSPKRITLESPVSEKVVKAGESVDLTFKVESYNAITGNYIECLLAAVVLKVDDGTLSDSVVLSDRHGKASVSWTPFLTSADKGPKTLTAYIYDSRGGVIDMVTFVARSKEVKKVELKEVDLGLSVKWASCNIGASSPEEYGDYYAWGEPQTKGEFKDRNSKTLRVEINTDISGDPNYDAATANFAKGWRMPTKGEFEELISKCSWEWTTVNDINGCRVTGPNGKSIFLPAAGSYIADKKLDSEGECLMYWSSTPETDYSYRDKYADYFLFAKGIKRVLYGLRSNGMPIRPVKDK